MLIVELLFKTSFVFNLFYFKLDLGLLVLVLVYNYIALKSYTFTITTPSILVNFINSG